MLVVVNNRFYLCSRITHKPARLQDDSEEEEEKEEEEKEEEEEEEKDDCDSLQEQRQKWEEMPSNFAERPTPPLVPGIYLSVIIGDCIFKEIMLYTTTIYSFVLLVLYF